MRIARFLHNPKVTVDEMVGTARTRTCAQVGGRHVLAIQDTSALRVDEKGLGLSFHPVIAVDASEGTVLGLVEAFFLTRQGGERGKRKQKPFEEKDSRRWLEGAQAASALADAGAAMRHGDRRPRRRHLRMLRIQADRGGEAGAGGPGPPSGRRNLSVRQG